jgi:hypothetical protein
VGDKFFRVAFLSHSDVTALHPRDENVERTEYVKYLENVSYADFSPSFLNIPKFDDDYYFGKFWSLVWQGITRKKVLSIPIIVLLVLVLWYLLETGMWTFIGAKLDLIGDLVKKFKII